MEKVDDAVESDRPLAPAWQSALGNSKYSALISEIVRDFEVVAGDPVSEERLRAKYTETLQGVGDRCSAVVELVCALIDSCSVHRPLSAAKPTPIDTDISPTADAKLTTDTRKHVSLVQLTRIWGVRVVDDYSWGDESTNFCSYAYTLARTIKDWTSAVGYLNQILVKKSADWSRMQSKPGQGYLATVHLKEARALRQSCHENQDGGSRPLTTDDCLALGLTLDRHGLIDVLQSKIPDLNNVKRLQLRSAFPPTASSMTRGIDDTSGHRDMQRSGSVHVDVTSRQTNNASTDARGTIAVAPTRGMEDGRRRRPSTRLSTLSIGAVPSDESTSSSCPIDDTRIAVRRNVASPSNLPRKREGIAAGRLSGKRPRVDNVSTSLPTTRDLPPLLFPPPSASSSPSPSPLFPSLPPSTCSSPPPSLLSRGLSPDPHPSPPSPCPLLLPLSAASSRYARLSNGSPAVDPIQRGLNVVKEWECTFGAALDRLSTEIEAARSRRPAGPPTIRDCGFDLAGEIMDQRVGAGWANSWSPIHSNGHILAQDRLREDADIWILSKQELDDLLEAKVPITRPVLGRGWMDRSDLPTIRHYTQHLVDLHGREGEIEIQRVDVSWDSINQDCQDGGGVGDRVNNSQEDDDNDGEVGYVSQTQAVSCSELHAIFSKSPKPTIDGTHYPVNCLNLRQTIKLGVPGFLLRRNFNLIDVLDSRIERRHTPANGGAGKQSSSSPRPIDVASCSSFMLLAQRGSVSGWHVDILNATWVSCLDGLKLWPIVARVTTAEWDTLREDGPLSRLAMDHVAMVPVSPGDVLYMPAGVLVPHAPITVEDTLMYGGMVLDSDRIVEQLAGINNIMSSPMSTNEALQVQWPAMLEELADYASGPESRFVRHPAVVESIHRALVVAKATLACQCARCHDEQCPCALRGEQCNAWCHASRPTTSRKMRCMQR